MAATSPELSVPSLRGNSRQAAARLLHVPAGAAALFGWVLVALFNLNAIRGLGRTTGEAARAARQLHYFVDFGHTLAIGLSVAGAVLLWQRLGSKSRSRTLSAVTLASLVSFEFVLAKDLAGAAERWSGGSHTTLLVCALAAVASLTIPIAVATGMMLGRFSLRGVGLLLALAILFVNHRVLVNGYPDGHLWIAATGATLFGASLSGLEAGRMLRRLGAPLGMFTPSAGWIAYGVLWLLVLPTLVVRLPSKLSIEMAHRETAFLARALSLLHARAQGSATIPPELAPWYEPRAGRPDVPPHPTRILPPAPIVIVVTIDAVRADLLERKNAKYAPNLHAMKERSVYFSQARASATDTRMSLGCMFAGRYLSQLRWSRAAVGTRVQLGEDPGARIPEVLRPHGVRTVAAVAYPEALGPEGGIVRGFDVHEIIPGEKTPESTPRVIDYAVELLKGHGAGPLFFYTHLLDPHAPYEQHGKKKQAGYRAYLGEVTYVDRHLGRLRKAVRQLGLADRTLFIVSSDHGEAFGEHGLVGHNKPLYDMLVRVPLLIEYPGLKPRVVRTPVSLMDIGPTVFDAFGVATPGYWMGESLVPMLLGEPAEPHRPLFMERFDSRAVLFADGVKVMLSDSPRSEEIYDTRKDPGELEDLRESLGAEGARRVALARQYAAAHAWPNGEPPQRAR